MKFISLCFANVVNIKGICNKKTEKKPEDDPLALLAKRAAEMGIGEL